MLAMESRMSALKIDPELLRELLNAASRTALTHRGSESEAYVLGQLEATANFAYVLAAGSDNEELELLCQQIVVLTTAVFPDNPFLCESIRAPPVSF